MAERVPPEDAAFLHLETPTTPMHVGSVAVLEPPAEGFDYERLVELIGQRIGLVPRFRQRVRRVPGSLAGPVWVDDEHFDLTYHVRRSALPRPGTDAQLRELVGRLMSRRLDRTRPLWEIYLVEGLAGGRTGVVTKTSQAVVDGVAAVDLLTVLLDTTPEPRAVPPDAWTPRREPGVLRLAAGAVTGIVRRPPELAGAVRGAARDLRATAERLPGVTGGLVGTALAAVRPAPSSPLSAALGEHRRFGAVATDLDDYRLVRAAHGGTVNDVVLAVVAGALRSWLMARGESVRPGGTVRATVPVSVHAEGARGNRVASWFVDLPVGEGSPVMRLHQVSFAMRGHNESGTSVGAQSLVHLSGFAPATLHALGARVASEIGRRASNLVVTNVPGPQVPLYAAGARMLEMYPVVPLPKGQGLAVGVTSYDGRLFYGLNADRDALPDVDVLAACLEESLAELRGTVRP